MEIPNSQINPILERPEAPTLESGHDLVAQGGPPASSEQIEEDRTSGGELAQPIVSTAKALDSRKKNNTFGDLIRSLLDFNTKHPRQRIEGAVPDSSDYYEIVNGKKVKKSASQLEVGSSGCHFKKYLKFGVPKKALDFFKSMLFLKDNKHPIRWLGVANELAEAGEESFENQYKPAAKPFYYGFWGTCLSYLGSRIGIHAMDDQSFTSGLQMMAHDGAAAVVLPTIVVRFLNKIVNGTLNVLGMQKGLFADIVRPLISFPAAKFSVSKIFDPIIGDIMKKHLEPKFFNKLRPWLDSKVHPVLEALTKSIFKPQNQAASRMAIASRPAVRARELPLAA